MIKSITIFLVLFLGAVAFSAEVDYITYESSGRLINATKAICRAGEENLCQYMCGSQQECLREEGLCTNCAGTNDLFLRLLFTRLNTNFKVTEHIWPNQTMMVYLADEPHILFDYESVYNFHKIWGSQEIQYEFKTFCPTDSRDPIFIINLDEKNQPRDVVGVICSDASGQSYVRVVVGKNEINSKYINPFKP